jgi:hypothetical protein
VRTSAVPISPPADISPAMLMAVKRIGARQKTVKKEMDPPMLMARPFRQPEAASLTRRRDSETTPKLLLVIKGTKPTLYSLNGSSGPLYARWPACWKIDLAIGLDGTEIPPKTDLVGMSGEGFLSILDLPPEL